MALLQPVAPGTLNPNQLAAQSGPVAPTGFAARGPVSFQQSIAGMAKNPMEAALARASNQAGQVQTLPARPVPAVTPVTPVTTAQQPVPQTPATGIDFGTYTPDQWQQLADQQRQVFLNSNIGKGNEAAAMQRYTPANARAYAEINVRQGLDPSGALSQTDLAGKKQNVINSMLAQGQPYLGDGTWSNNGQQYKPSVTEQAIGDISKGGPGSLLSTDTKAWANHYGVDMNKAAKSYAVTPDLLKRMMADPSLANRFAIGAGNLSYNFENKVADQLAKEKAAYEAQMAQYRAARGNQSSGGFFGSAGNLGNFLSGMNPFNIADRVGSGKGTMGDYLKVASFLL